MLDDIVAHDIAQGISVPISTTQNCLLTPWARIASRLRAHPAGLALLISEQTFQEQARIRRNTLLREQRTYPLLDLSKRRRPQRKRLLNRRGPRPRHSNHGCPWIQKPANKATVMLEHDPEKWVPVFRKDHAQIKETERDDDSKKRHHALVINSVSAFGFRRGRSPRMRRGPAHKSRGPTMPELFRASSNQLPSVGILPYERAAVERA